MAFDIIGFGALNFDKLYKVERIAHEGEHVSIENVMESPGGSAANTISALGRLGLKTGFIGAIGDDNEGKIILDDFKKFKVNMRGIKKIKKKRTGIIIGFVDKEGERTLYPYPGANSFLEKKDIKLNYVKSAKFLHLTSFVNEKQFELQKWLVEKISDNEVKVSFSPGDLYVKKGLSKLSIILKRSEVVFFNADEIEMLIGLNNYVRAAEFLVDYGVKIVVVTLGKKGCYIRAKNEQIRERAFKVKKVIDTTGAGDAFAAGFLYGLLKNEPLQTCGKLGNFLASRCIRKFGARAGLPTKEEIERKFLRLIL